jgi:hypothetical protein
MKPRAIVLSCLLLALAVFAPGETLPGLAQDDTTQ